MEFMLFLLLFTFKYSFLFIPLIILFISFMTILFLAIFGRRLCLYSSAIRGFTISARYLPQRSFILLNSVLL